MSTLYLRRVPHGFVPDTEEDQEKCKRFRLGAVVKAEITNPRNLKFFRKWWALVQVGFEMWEETGIRNKYKGEEVLPNFERFRKDVTILAGFGYPVININGDVRMEAESISFANMSEESFEKLYNATLTVLVHKVMRGRVSEERLKQMAESIEEFA
jgi:hypothetical protein